MSIRIYRTWQSVILAGWAAFILSKWIFGTVMEFISPELAWLSILSVIILAYQSQAILKYRHREKDSGRNISPGELIGLFWMVLPLLAGIFFTGHIH